MSERVLSHLSHGISQNTKGLRCKGLLQTLVTHVPNKILNSPKPLQETQQVILSYLMLSTGWHAYLPHNLLRRRHLISKAEKAAESSHFRVNKKCQETGIQKDPNYIMSLDVLQTFSY